MAKKTKDSNLSIEERLEQALIPNWDEPYKLPPNWCWINLKSVLRHQSGNSKLIKGKLSPEKSDGLYDAYSASGQDVYTESYEHEGDAIIVSAVGARCGKAFLANGKWSAIANTHIIYSNDRLLDIRYLHYVLNDESWWVKSGSAQPFVVVNESLLRPFALPPLQEQQRIVSRIESMFTKLDEAKEKAQEVVDGFETRKAAILHKAFSGELTAKWREENEIPANSWQETKLGYVLREIKYGSSEKSDYSYTGIPVLRIPNIGDMELIFDDLKFLRQNDCLPNEYLEENDILIIRSNGSKDLVGKCALVKDLDQKYTYASFLIRLRVLDGVYSPYIVWYLNSESARKQLFRKAKSSAGIHNINSKEISDIDIKIPRIPEQEKIVENLSALMEKEKQAKEIAEAVIEQIDTMKKAILARAFRGELGTNDPSEESAVELLKKVLGGDAAVQTPAKKPTKRISIPSDIKELLSNIREEEIIKLLLKSAPQPVTIQEIMSLSSKKFELMDALRSLEKKQLITKNEFGEYSLTR